MADYHMSHTGAELDLAISRVISDYKDTSDATAQASNIQSGFTAYAGGAKITGTHVCPSSPRLQTKSVTPTESDQAVLPDTGYGGLSRVNVSGIPGNYVGSGVSRRTSSSLTVSGGTVTAPAGYYASSASKSVASGTQGTPTATKGTVSNHSVSVTPRCTDTTGYITGTTKTGTAVTVTAAELVSGTRSITANGEVDVTNYQKVNVNVSGDAPRLQTKTVTPNAAGSTVSPDSGYDGLSSVTVSGDSDLTAGNIRSGVNIFGVTGTYTGGGSGVTVEPLSVTANGTYTAPSGKAYSPITVNVQGGAIDETQYEVMVTMAGTEVSVDIDVPAKPREFMFFPNSGLDLSGDVGKVAYGAFSSTSTQNPNACTLVTTHIVGSSTLLGAVSTQWSYANGKLHITGTQSTPFMHSLYYLYYKL